MRKTIKAIGLTISIALIISVALGERPGFSPLPASDDKTDEIRIYVTDLGYHAGIVVPVDNVVSRPDLVQLNKAVHWFEDVDWLEIGWGDRAFYQAGSWDQIDASSLLRALFLSTDSVVHIVGFRGHPPTAYSYNTVFELTISRDGLNNMLREIDATLDLDPEEVPQTGLYGNSRFFPPKATIIFSISAITGPHEGLLTPVFPSISPWRPGQLCLDWI